MNIIKKYFELIIDESSRTVLMLALIKDEERFKVVLGFFSIGNNGLPLALSCCFVPASIIDDEIKLYINPEEYKRVKFDYKTAVLSVDRHNDSVCVDVDSDNFVSSFMINGLTHGYF